MKRAREDTRVSMMKLVECFTVKLTKQPKQILFKKKKDFDI